MSRKIVWASNAMINPGMLRPIRHSFADSGEENKQRMLKAAREIKTGKVLSADYFPETIYVAKDADTNYDKLADLFYAYGYWVVSGKVAAIMQRFDMGGGGLYPTKVFRKDRKTPIGDEWFCLNFGNVKRAFVPEESREVPRFGSGKSDLWSEPMSWRDNLLAVDEVALNGPDVWVDERLLNIFFLSDGLASALKEAGVARPFGLKKCRVV